MIKSLGKSEFCDEFYGLPHVPQSWKCIYFFSFKFWIKITTIHGEKLATRDIINPTECIKSIFVYSFFIRLILNNPFRKQGMVP